MEPNQPVNPQPPVQPEIPQDSKFSFIKYIKVWQIVILLILLIPTTAYLLNKNQSVKQIPTVQSSQIPTPTPDPTANWKAFSNDKFSFKYPPLFSVKEKNRQDLDQLSYDLTFTTGRLINGQEDWSGFSVFVDPTNGKTITQAFDNQPSGFGDSTINVQSIPTESGADEAADLINSAQNTTVYRFGKNFFKVSHFQNSNVLPDRSDDIMKYYDQILSTLKFNG